VKSALPKLVKSLSPKGGRLAAEAIMTTDTRPKEAAVRVEVNGRPVTVGGIAKGVGMIEPHMATMFCFLATDAAVSTAALSRLLKSSVNRSLNRITVDGDQSTSDTVAILANGLAENAALEGSARGLRQLGQAIDAVTERLARMLASDGEGASKLIEIAVRGAATRRDALIAARSVANSPLVKTAINGGDPNWGRIMMALGKSAARIAQDKVSIAFGDEPIVECGMLRADVRVQRIREIMALPEYGITIDLGLGKGQEKVWTCDLSEEYVRINAKYTT
jgi:glutamate N-acetyltransferase/amino-acid N-acetyltransferase